MGYVCKTNKQTPAICTYLLMYMHDADLIAYQTVISNRESTERKETRNQS